MADFVLIHKEDEGNFAKNEGEYWQKLTDGKIIDFDLYTACAIGDFGYVESYLSNAKHRPDIINKKNNGGWTPLMYVCCIGHDKILELLIQQRVNIEAPEEKHGTTPLMLASSSGNTSVVKRLVERGAEINAVDKSGRTALYHAVEQGHLNVVEFLLANKADAFISDYVYGYTPFMEAARNGNEFVFNRFLEHGVDLGQLSKKGLTCRDLAYQNDAMVIVNMIDNHDMKRTSSSLRDEPDLGVLDFGVEVEQQPRQKVHDWLNVHGPDFVRANTEAVGAFDSGDKSSFLLHRNSSYPVSIEPRESHCSRGDPYGMSADTLVDSDRTPVGTPVDSILQNYMGSEKKHLERYFNDNLPDVESFLEKLHLEKYQSIFQEESVDFKVLVSLTEEDFKDLGLKLGPRKKLKTAIAQWKYETGSPLGGQGGVDEVLSIKRQQVDVLAKLQRLKGDLVLEKDARSLLEAELMEERAKRNHMYYIAGKIKRSCQELQHHNKDLREVAKSLEKCVLADNIGDDFPSKLKTLHIELSENVQSTDYNVETILRGVRKMMSDDLTGCSSESDSPSESSCTSVSKSEGSIS